MWLGRLLLSFEGRIGRGKYWLGQVLVLLWFYGGLAVVGVVTETVGRTPQYSPNAVPLTADGPLRHFGRARE
jgi:uncharacterized membrane protein YhaH (DUF805 family)